MKLLPSPATLPYPSPMETMWPPFTAQVVSGSRRGRTLGYPTLNLSLEALPSTLLQGIYACRARVHSMNAWIDAVMHFGPRPVFQDTETCEVHLLDTSLPSPPSSLEVSVLERIRDVADFPSQEALKQQIICDIETARAILARHPLPR